MDDRTPRLFPALGLLLSAGVSLAPFAFERTPVRFASPWAEAWAAWASKAAVLMVMTGLIAFDAWRARRVAVAATLAGFAALLTACHWYEVDNASKIVHGPAGNYRSFYADGWQREHYLAILNRELEDVHHSSNVPHVYRILPYGFTRALEWMTGDWRFACTAYRWFFTYWFLWAYVEFGRRFLSGARALLAPCVLIILYPLSIQYYLGQLTDPMSHAFFVLGLLYIVDDEWLLLAGALALGVLAKETAVVLVPAYLACHWRQGTRAWLKTATLGALALAVAVAVRIPLGWRPEFGSVNGTEGLMVEANLGIGRPLYRGRAPTYQNYLHLLWFIGVFLPGVARRWQLADRRLRALFLTVVPLVLASSLCFGWLYESRNYVPLLPILTTIVLTPRAPRLGEQPLIR